MAIEIPDDWPVRGWAEEPPLAHLETISSDAVSGVAPTRWYVSSWSSVREMKSSALPGQVRHQTGLSIGTGKALVKREHNDFPWKHGLVYDLSGQDAQILLAPRNSTEIPTGQFQVAEINGDLTTVGLQVELDEKTIEGKDKTPGVLDQEWASDITQEEINAQEKDPIWLVAELAEQMGFLAGPNVTPGEDGYNPILDVPLQGSLLPRQPLNVPFSTVGTLSWGSTEGAVGLSTSLDSSLTVFYDVERVIPGVFTWTFDLSDQWAGFRWDDANTPGQFGVQVETNIGDSTVDMVIFSTGYNGVGNTVTNVPAQDITRNPDAPNRIQVEVTLTAGSEFSWSSASVRIRRESGAWFGPFVHVMPNGVHRLNEHNIWMEVFEVGTGPAVLSNYSVVDNSVVSSTVRDTLLTSLGGDQGRIYLEPLLGTVTSPWLNPDLGVWSTMQAIVEAWQGALFPDVYGDLKVLNRNTLVGLNNLQQERVVDVGLNFEDLPWVMNWADQADRLVVRYRPVNQVIADDSQTGLPTIYSFEDILIVWPGSNEYFFTLEYIYPLDLKLNPFIRKDSDNGFYHVWDAHRYNNGSGAHISAADIDLEIVRVTSATWKMLINNKTGSPFHMVDSSGTPWLKLRSSYYYDQTQEKVIERGVSAGESKSAIEINLGHYVQNEDDANALADFIWGRANQRSWRANTVTLVPDYRLDLGDVIEIQHHRTGVKSNALVSKVDMSGALGEVVQKADLVLIPPTWEDFDENWANALPSSTWDTFDALWDDYTWDDFERTPTATTVAEIEEAM